MIPRRPLQSVPAPRTPRPAGTVKNAHSERTIRGVRFVMDWFWDADNERTALRCVNMKTGHVSWLASPD